MFEPPLQSTKPSKPLSQTLRTKWVERPEDDQQTSGGQIRLVPVQPREWPSKPVDKVSSIHASTSSRPMTPQGAASFLGLDEKTVTRWARKGYLPGHPLGEGKRKYWRFLESELSDWLAAKSNGTKAA
jgi:excisionase family DNA binding protein